MKERMLLEVQDIVEMECDKKGLVQGEESDEDRQGDEKRTGWNRDRVWKGGG